MGLKNWFRSLVGRTTTTIRNHRRLLSHERSIRLLCEHLEDRITPSTLLDNVNGSQSPPSGYHWIATDTGWYYTPSNSYSFNQMGTNFANNNIYQTYSYWNGYQYVYYNQYSYYNVTAKIWDGGPTGTLLASNTQRVYGAGGSYNFTFSPVTFTANHTYFIGFSSPSDSINDGVGENVTTASGATSLDYNYYDFDNTGSYNYYESGSTAQPILNFYHYGPPSGITTTPSSGSSRSATISFTATNEGYGVAGFQYLLDNGSWTNTPNLGSNNGSVSLANLADGPHSFTVRAYDNNSVYGDNSGTAYWYVDGTPPQVSINTKPSSLTRNTSASFSVSATDPVVNGFDSGLYQVLYWIDNNTPTTSYYSPTVNPSFSGLADGTHTFHVYAVDGYGNTSSTSTYSWTVDTTPPSINSPANETVEATGPSGAVVTYTATATATDLVDGTDPVISTPASGSTFALGTTTVHLTATDNAGNTANSSFTVTVQDTTPPTILNTPSNITQEATGPSGAVVTYVMPTATDLVDGTDIVNTDHASGSTFALGITTVHFTATDNAGNAAHSSFTVTVQDTTPPTILNTPSNITQEATGPNGAVVTYVMPTATDLVDGTDIVTTDHASGSTFALGTTTVHLTATDNAGNTANSSFTVTVQDTTPPTILNTPSNITQEATGPSGAVVTYVMPTATDLVDGTDVVNTDHASGSTFALGITTVHLTATDAHGNAAYSSFTITVQDTTPPIILNTPANVIVVGTSSSGANVTYTMPTATDLVDGTDTVNTDHASGSLFALGTTTVHFTATDAHGNAAHSSFNVTVEDPTPPTITTAPTSGPEGTAVTFQGSFTDGGVTTDHYTYLWCYSSTNGDSGSKTGMLTTAGAVPALTFTPVDSGNYTVTLKITNGNNYSRTSAGSLFTATNVAPTVTSFTATDGIDGQRRGLLYNPVAVAIQITDPSWVSQTGVVNTETNKDTFTYQIDWTGSGTFTDSYTNVASLSLATSHSYDTPGTYTPKVRVIDSDNGVSLTASLGGGSFTITNYHALVIGGNLVVSGGIGNLLVTVDTTYANNLVVKINNSLITNPAGGAFAIIPATDGHVIIYGGPGNDTLKILGTNHAVNAELHAGAGNNSLYGGYGNNVLFGGAGNNLLVGGSGGGNDVLIAGSGSSVLRASGGNNILIAGQVSSSYNYDALRALSDSWAQNYAHPSQSLLASLNTLLAATTHPSAPNVYDQMTGGSGANVFMAHVTGSTPDYIFDNHLNDLLLPL